jgi:hypothetical protein
MKEINSLDIFFEDNTLTNYVKSKLDDPWKGTNFEGYLKLSASQMGFFGQSLVAKIMHEMGCEVSDRLNSGHDKVIDGYKTEIKFSLSTQKDKFIFNHIACHKDWDRLIILGVNFDNHFRMNWIDKEDFVNNINSSNRIFRRQQGGQDGDNDDYMYAEKYLKLKNTGILQDMVSWMNHGKKLTGIEFWYESI